VNKAPHTIVWPRWISGVGPGDALSPYAQNFFQVRSRIVCLLHAVWRLRNRLVPPGKQLLQFLQICRGLIYRDSKVIPEAFRKDKGNRGKHTLAPPVYTVAFQNAARCNEYDKLPDFHRKVSRSDESPGVCRGLQCVS
jgi:hypothetical protein